MLFMPLLKTEKATAKYICPTGGSDIIAAHLGCEHLSEETMAEVLQDECGKWSGSHQIEQEFMSQSASQMCQSY